MRYKYSTVRIDQEARVFLVRLRGWAGPGWVKHVARLPGAKFDRDAKTWTVPAKCAAGRWIQERLDRSGWQMSPSDRRTLRAALRCAQDTISKG